jgi:hypothetical protein
MALQFRDVSAPGNDTLTAEGKIGSDAPVVVQTPDAIQLAVTDDEVTLVGTGRVAPGDDALVSLGKSDVLFTDGATRMTFVNDGANTHDIISATGGAAQQSFGDSVVNFKPGDSLLVLGFGAGSQNSPLPLPPGVTETAFGTASSELNIDFNGGTTPTGHVVFENISLQQLALTHHVSTGTDHGVPFLMLT